MMWHHNYMNTATNPNTFPTPILSGDAAISADCALHQAYLNGSSAVTVKSGKKLFVFAYRNETNALRFSVAKNERTAPLVEGNYADAMKFLEPLF